MNPEAQFCPNSACHASGKPNLNDIVVHSRKQRRYKCTCCGKTFTESKGTDVYGLKKPTELFVIVVTLLAHGCPVQEDQDKVEANDWGVRGFVHQLMHLC